jgi:flagellar biosynthesis chaperone FliJ
MAFHFSLQVLLRLWEGRERLEHLRLEALAVKILHLRNELNAVAEDSRKNRAALANMLTEGLAGSQLHFAALCEDGRRLFCEMVGKQMTELIKQHRAQQKTFENARRQREILESLRRRKLEIYRTEEARRLQREADELYLVRLVGESNE